MISFAGILQRFWSDVQISYFVEHCLMTIQKISKYAIVYYIISLHYFSCSVFDWYRRNKINEIQSLLNCVPCLLNTCSRINVYCALTCSRTNMPCVLYVPTCSWEKSGKIHNILVRILVLKLCPELACFFSFTSYNTTPLIISGLMLVCKWAVVNTLV